MSSIYDRTDIYDLLEDQTPIGVPIKNIGKRCYKERMFILF